MKGRVRDGRGYRDVGSGYTRRRWRRIERIWRGTEKKGGHRRYVGGERMRWKS